ncbi:hypothetical protein Q8F55_005447 [Vanrija albida]|uniref:Stc1 domain-containing protein n=1 Tax=Vanrija albida TaxID=181172 RepID=A0ABR3Q1P2_9TREE
MFTLAPLALSRSRSRSRETRSEKDIDSPHPECLDCVPATRAQKLFGRKALRARAAKCVFCPSCARRDFHHTFQAPLRHLRPSEPSHATTHLALQLRAEYNAAFDPRHPRSSFREVRPARLYSAFTPVTSTSGSTTDSRGYEASCLRGYPVYSDY